MQTCNYKTITAKQVEKICGKEVTTVSVFMSKPEEVLYSCSKHKAKNQRRYVVGPAYNLNRIQDMLKENLARAALE